MKGVYKITTKYSSFRGTHRNVCSYHTVAANLPEAVRKTESYLKKNDRGAERPDEVELVCELDF